MESAILLLLGLLAIAVVYIVASLRHYQRIDYSRILEQDDYARALDSRIEYLEDLIAQQQDEHQQREAEHQQRIDEARLQFAAELAAVRSSGAAQAQQVEVLAAEADQTGSVPSAGDAQQQPARSCVGRPRPTAQVSAMIEQAPPPPADMLFFRCNSRQQEIAALLEAGDSPAEISRKLGASFQEIDLVNSLVFRLTRTA